MIFERFLTVLRRFGEVLCGRGNTLVSELKVSEFLLCVADADAYSLKLFVQTLEVRGPGTRLPGDTDELPLCEPELVLESGHRRLCDQTLSGEDSNDALSVLEGVSGRECLPFHDLDDTIEPRHRSGAEAESHSQLTGTLIRLLNEVACRSECRTQWPDERPHNFRDRGADVDDPDSELSELRNEFNDLRSELINEVNQRWQDLCAQLDSGRLESSERSTERKVGGLSRGVERLIEGAGGVGQARKDRSVVLGVFSHQGEEADHSLHPTEDLTERGLVTLESFLQQTKNGEQSVIPHRLSETLRTEAHVA